MNELEERATSRRRRQSVCACETCVFATYPFNLPCGACVHRLPCLPMLVVRSGLLGWKEMSCTLPFRLGKIALSPAVLCRSRLSALRRFRDCMKFADAPTTAALPLSEPPSCWMVHTPGSPVCRMAARHGLSPYPMPFRPLLNPSEWSSPRKTLRILHDGQPACESSCVPGVAMWQILVWA